LRKNIVPLNQVVPQHILGEVKSCSSFDARKKITEKWLVEKLLLKKKDHYLTFVRDLAESYKQSAMQFNVSQLAEKHFTTSRTVNRYFHRVIGISPKGYFSILRARTALTAYTKDRHLFDPCVFGYYDHSHFYKEATCFTGFSLSRF
jgi:methylphosphotriester-DNA--protein-cysteine methyltransferase